MSDRCKTCHAAITAYTFGGGYYHSDGNESKIGHPAERDNSTNKAVVRAVLITLAVVALLIWINREDAKNPVRQDEVTCHQEDFPSGGQVCE